MPNKKALSPLVATILLVVFALIIGTVTMSLGKTYIEESGLPIDHSMLMISMEKVDTPLKDLQIRYITDKINLEEYLREEKKVIQEMEQG